MNIIVILIHVADILKQAVHVCCFGCVKIEYLPIKKLSDIRTVDDNYTVLMPIMAGVNAEDYGGVPFASFVSSPAVVYVTYDKGHQKAVNDMVNTLIGNWSLMLVAVVLCFEAGILIWLLVSNITNSCV